MMLTNSGVKKRINENSYSCPLPPAIIKLYTVPKITIVIPQILIIFAIVLSDEIYVCCGLNCCLHDIHLYNIFSSSLKTLPQFGQVFMLIPPIQYGIKYTKKIMKNQCLSSILRYDKPLFHIIRIKLSLHKAVTLNFHNWQNK